MATSKANNAVRRNQGPVTRQASENFTAKFDDGEKQSKKMVRILAVVAYLISVSMGAVILGIYYSIFWEHPDPDALTPKIPTQYDILNVSSIQYFNFPISYKFLYFGFYI